MGSKPTRPNAAPTTKRGVRAQPSSQPAAPKRPVGAPTKYTPDLAAKICALMSKGELLIEITQQPGMPTYSTIWRWQVDRPDFRDLYARAREMQGHALADRAVMAARYATPEDAAAARLKFDADRWLAGKVAPKVYGDKVGVEHSGNLTLESLVTQSFQVAIESGEG